jgi:serine/threonine-protein kinase
MDNALQPTNPTPVSANGPAGVLAGEDLSGKTLGDFLLLRRLGQGGMGHVYLAEQVSLKRKVAVKIMRADLAASPTALQRFQAEAKAIARVTHANIVQVYSIGAADGLHFMSLEYVEGRTLRESIARKGTPELAHALSIMRQVAAAMQEAHEAGIIHRDIKPENILLTRKGEVKVADFGLSRIYGGDLQPVHLTQSGVSMGTPLYMSPEQVQGKELDPRTDLYSFGVTCYHMLAGEPPFRGQSPFEVALQHVTGEAVPLQQLRPDLPIELCQVVHRLMAKDPNQRYPSAGDLLADLERLSEGLSATGGMKTGGLTVGPAGRHPPVPNSRTTLGVSSVPSFRAGRLLWGLAVTVSLLAAVAAGAALRLTRNPGPPLLEPSPELSAAGEAVRTGNGNGDREAALLAIVNRDANLQNQDDFRRHLDATVQLGLLHLDQRRLDKAESLFRDLRERPPGELRVYGAWGKIGQAATLAFQDKAADSIKLFRELESTRMPLDKGGGRPGFDWRQFMVRGMRDLSAETFLLSTPQVRRVVSEALDHNAANLGEPVPPELERLRKMPIPVGRPGGFPMPGGGKQGGN